jgi:hypothetical protein
VAGLLAFAEPGAVHLELRGSVPATGASVLDRLFDAWHGWALAGKTLLVLALGNRSHHTPALARGDAGAGERLAAAIRLEMIVVALVFHAAAEMSSVHPADYGHRVQG